MYNIAGLLCVLMLFRRFFVLSIVIFCLLLFCFQVHAQQEKEPTQEVIRDTVVVKKNSYVVTKDSVFFVDEDTVFYVKDTLEGSFEEVLHEEDYPKERDFYRNLKKRLSKRKATKRLFDLLFDVSDKKKKPKKDSLAHIPKRYDGKIVGQISIKQIDIFGPKVTDTTGQPKTGVARFFNKMHVNTRDRVIRNNLLIKEGDFINQHKIADNERMLRLLKFIRDARIIIQPRATTSDTVDLLVITQDVMSLSGSLEPEGLTEATIHVNDNNILGTGHQMDNAILIEPEEKQYLGYRGTYQMPNIGGSFLEANLNYYNTNFEDIYRLQVNRDFVVPAIKYAGGAELSFIERTTFAPWIDSYYVADTFSSGEEIPMMPYSLWYQDYWLARSFVPDFVIQNKRSRVTMALRYSQTHFKERPFVLADSNTAFHNTHLVLAKLGFSKRYYTTEQMVYTYGRTEDIPIGHLLEFTGGPQLGEFYNRWYTGISYSFGRYLNRWGYLSFLSEVGGFLHRGNMEEGVFQIGIKSFSYLIHWNRTKYRFFLKANYTTGIQRAQTIDFRDNYIDIRDENGIRGLSSSEMEGNERLSLSLESVAYTPYSLYGFRLAFFTFADIGWISQPGEIVFNSKTFQGYGMGVRVRNENLAFKTFQIRLAVYPIVPNGETLFGISIGSIPLPGFRDFNTKKPEIVQFN